MAKKKSWGPGLFDLDNDGDLDLFFANGHLNSVSGDNRQSNLLFNNDGTGLYTDVSKSSGILETGQRIHRSAMFADYDNDGQIDMFVTVMASRLRMEKARLFMMKTKERVFCFKIKQELKIIGLKYAWREPNQIVMLMAHQSLSL